MAFNNIINANEPGIQALDSTGKWNGRTITAGAGISVINGNGESGNPIISANTFTYTNVTSAMSPYTVLSTDQYISVNSSGGAVTLRFPNTPVANQVFYIKDRTGNSASNNITITTLGGSTTFDGATSYLLQANFVSRSIIGNGTSYEIF